MSTTSTSATTRASVTAPAPPLKVRVDNAATQDSPATDGHAGVVPGDDTGAYTLQRSLRQAAGGADPDGFYLHDVSHWKAGGIPVIPLERYRAGKGTGVELYESPSGQSQEVEAQLLAGMRQSRSERETASQMFKALPAALSLPLSETYDGTKQFIMDHPFFHQGLMDLPIGFDKHSRNVPFIGPARIIWGVMTLNRDQIAKGAETTRGTWDAA